MRSLIVAIAIVLATSSQATLAGGKSGGSGDSHPAGASTSADKTSSPKLFKNAVAGKHFNEATISTRKSGSGKVSHSDMNMQKTNDKASPNGLKDNTSIKGESMDDVHKDPIEVGK